MKSRFTIRQLDQSDTEQLRALLATRDGMDEEQTTKRLALVEWAAFNNPHAQGEPTYFVAEQEGRLIAHLGRMPAFFSKEGNRIRGYFVHDLYVHPEHRDGGKGLSLSVALYKATREQSDSFTVLLWTTMLNLQIQRRLGYVEDELKNYVKLLRAEPIVKRVFSSERIVKTISILPNLLLSALDAMRIRLDSRLTRVVPIERFDHRFDDLSERVSARLGIHSVKDAETLNWRYAKRPFHHNGIYAAVRGEKALGYLVVAVQMARDAPVSSAIIVDLMADPDDKDTVAALMAAAVRFSRRNGADVIQCVVTQPEFAAILPRFLFVNRPTWRVPLMLGNLEKSPPDNGIVADSTKWHITKGESDGFMFL